MPRVTLQALNSANAEPSVIATGTTLGEFMETYADVAPNKVQILVNGVETSNLNHELCHGDSIVLKPRNFSSGVEERNFIVCMRAA